MGDHHGDGMSYGLTSQGWIAKRAADVLASLRDEIVTRLDAAGLPSDIDWSRDTIGGIVTEALAVELGALWEATGAVYDAGDPANAVGVLLDNIGAIRGVPRLGATRSRATVTLNGAPGTVIPSGSQVQGGGDGEDPARWETVETVTLDGIGDGSVEVVALTLGAVLAGSLEIVQIVTPIAGWAAVFNPAPAVPGRDVESDTAYRARQRLRLVGGGSVGAIRLALLSVDGVQAAVVLENRTDSPITIGTKTLDPHSILPILLPSSLTASQREAVGLVLFQGAAGIRVGYSGGTDNLITVEGDGFGPVLIGWDDAGTDPIPVVVTLTLASGVALVDVQASVEVAVEGYFDGLEVGGIARLLGVQVACASVPGVVGALVTLDGSAADYTPAIFDLVTISALTVTT